jgi:phospholipase/carboxylesterase
VLPFDHRLPDEAGDGMPLLVLLHGRGSHQGDLQALQPAIPAKWGLVTPQAPHPGLPWGYGHGWAWYRYLAEDRVDEETLRQSFDALDAFMDELPTALGVRPGRLALGGFSQGGTTALAWALRNPGRVDTVLMLSGFLVDAPSVPHDGAAGGSPRVFWGHGRKDPAIPLALAERGRKRLREAGTVIETHDYDIGHWIVPEEIEAASVFLEGGEG